MPQTVLLIHDDGARARRATDALFSSDDGFYNVEWVERCSEAVQRLRKDRKEGRAALLVNPFLPDGRGLETFDPIFHRSRRARNSAGQESGPLHMTCRDRSVSTGQQ
jgi:hypothetical protein